MTSLMQRLISKVVEPAVFGNFFNSLKSSISFTIRRCIASPWPHELILFGPNIFLLVWIFPRITVFLA